MFYNEGNIAPDILAQTSNEVLAYEILSLERTMMNSWFIHNGAVSKKIEEILTRADIVALSSLENGKNHN